MAESLDIHNIIWLRPPPVAWTDLFGKGHFYYPDFYLPDFNLYLDPKNPYCMKKDGAKLREVCKEIDLVYGGLDVIMNKIETLKDMG